MIFTKNRREYLADKFGDLANIVLAGLVLGQFISKQGFDLIVFVLGLIGGGFIYVFSLILKKEVI